MVFTKSRRSFPGRSTLGGGAATVLRPAEEFPRVIGIKDSTGDLARANAIQHRVTAVFDPLLQRADFPEGVRADDPAAPAGL